MFLSTFFFCPGLGFLVSLFIFIVCLIRFFVCSAFSLNEDHQSLVVSLPPFGLGWNIGIVMESYKLEGMPLEVVVVGPGSLIFSHFHFSSPT